LSSRLKVACGAFSERTQEVVRAREQKARLLLAKSRPVVEREVSGRESPAPFDIPSVNLRLRCLNVRTPARLLKVCAASLPPPAHTA
ncbi:MAG: hypothetical protein ACRETD_01840, partial [Steroidobacteraceae bacterium]